MSEAERTENRDRYLFRGKMKFPYGQKEGDWVYGGVAFFEDRAFIVGFPEPDCDAALRQLQFPGKHLPEAGKKCLSPLIEVDPATVGQCTGQRDRAKELIFEGDEVRILPDDEIGTVEWDPETSQFIIVQDDIITDFDHYNGYDLETIGPAIMQEDEHAERARKGTGQT